MGKVISTFQFSGIIQKILIGLSFILSGYLNTNGQNTDLSDFPELQKVYDINKNPVDFIIVVDQSGSVRNYWEPIKSSASKLVSLAKDGDYFTLIGFKETVDNLILARKINSSSRNAIIDEIKNLSQPRGSFTDLFESADFTLEKGINRPDGNLLQIIFYFTDFINDPPPGSKWRTTSPDILVEKRINYVDKTDKLINIFAFQLPLEAGAGRDFNQFSQIFDNSVKRIISDLNTMQEWFGRLSQEIAREKLKLLIKKDLEVFLTVNSISLSGNNIMVELQNNLGIPVEVEQAELKSLTAGLDLKQPLKNINIPANSSVIISLDITNFLLGHKSILEKNIPLKDPQFTFHCSFSELESEFGKLNIPTKQKLIVNLEKTINVKTGIPYWMLAVVTIVFILIIYMTYKIWIKPEWTFNRKGFKVTVALEGKLLANSGRSFEKSKKPVIIEHTIINSSDVRPEIARIISESQFKIFVIPAKPRFLSGKPTRGTYLFSEAKGLNFKVKKQVKSKVQFASLPTNRRLYAERVFLHKGVTIVGEITSGITKSKLEINFYNK